MEKEKNLLAAYLKGHCRGLLLYCLIAVIFMIIFYLYRIPVEAACYAAILSFFLILIVSIVDFYAYKEKQKELTSRRNNIMIGVDHLPEPWDYTEEQYQTLLKIVQNDKNEKIAWLEKQKNDLTEYFTMWAHQIKTPIAAIGLLLEELGEEEYQRKAEMDEELFKIRQYVDMVLQYLRLDSVTTDFVFREQDLDDMIRQAVHKYAAMFIRKKLKLSYDPVQQKVVTDEKWLVFVLEQVLSNAIKYTKKGTISIYMEPGKEKTLVIEDTGIGILPEDLPRVFDQGYTGYNGRSDKKATGIGLYLCRRVVSKLSHTIKMESEAGKGTRVLLDFSQYLHDRKE